MDMEGQTVDVSGDVYPKLKPIHIIVMIITALHAVAIGVWFMVFLSGSKGSSQVRVEPRPDATEEDVPTPAVSAEEKKTQ